MPDKPDDPIAFSLTQSQWEAIQAKMREIDAQMEQGEERHKQWLQQRQAQAQPVQAPSAPTPAPKKRKKRANPLDVDQKRLLTVQEAADMLGFSRPKLYPMVMRGEIASVKVGGQRFIPPSAVEQFIKEQGGDEETSEINRHRRVLAKKRLLPGTPAAG